MKDLTEGNRLDERSRRAPREGSDSVRKDFVILAAGAAITLFGLVSGANAAEVDPMAEAREKIAQCRTCHGLDGIGTNPTVPNLAGESDIYIMSQLKAFRDGKREHEVMSVVARDMSDEDIAAVARWYSAIKVTVTLPE